jgi:phenylacetate-CoA ligase
VNGARGLAAAVIGYPLAEHLESRDVRSKQSVIRREMVRSFAERRVRSWGAVVKAVSEAGRNVPYYRDLFSRIRFDPEKLQTDSRYLQDIPYLTKDIIRAQGDRLLRDNHAQVRTHVSKTGGSTGPTCVIIYDQEAADWSSALRRYARRQIGKRLFHSELHFATRFMEQIPLRDRLREQFKCFAMNRHNVFFTSFESPELESMWHRIKTVRPYLVHGHPSTMYQLALHVVEGSAAREAFRIFESSGEALDAYQRERITRVFKCHVVNCYGLAEIGVVAYQFDLHNPTMLVMDPIAWPEIDASQSELSSLGPDGIGELVVTAAKNRMMPLIRYRTGDLAVLRESSTGFILEKVIGRVHDIIHIGDRKVPTHHIQDVLNRIPGISEFQIQLRECGPVLRVVPEDSANRQHIHDLIWVYWQDAMQVEFITSSELQLLGWRGKFRHLVPNATPHLD